MVFSLILVYSMSMLCLDGSGLSVLDLLEALDLFCGTDYNTLVRVL